VGETDLTDVDLHDAVTIDEQEVEVYNEEKMGILYPKQGQKLNKTALITFNGIEIPRNKTYDQFTNLLRNEAKRKDVS
jgi:hypothetical protein